MLYYSHFYNFNISNRSCVSSSSTRKSCWRRWTSWNGRARTTSGSCRFVHARNAHMHVPQCVPQQPQGFGACASFFLSHLVCLLLVPTLLLCTCVSQVMRRYHIQNRDDYKKYNKIVGMITKLTNVLKQLDPKDATRIELTDQLLEK